MYGNISVKVSEQFVWNLIAPPLSTHEDISTFRMHSIRSNNKYQVLQYLHIIIPQSLLY